MSVEQLKKMRNKNKTQSLQYSIADIVHGMNVARGPRKTTIQNICQALNTDNETYVRNRLINKHADFMIVEGDIVRSKRR